MSSLTKGLPPRPTTLYGPKSKGHKGKYPLDTPPPSEHISYNQDQVGDQYGWVTIISPERRYNKNWSCCYVPTRCAGCGYEQWQHLANLAQGRSQGCQSCSQQKALPAWLDRRLTAAKQRCVNPNDPNWPHYGGRGIEFRFPSVTEAGFWVIRNLGLHRELELDRINNQGPYEPGNLRWATRSQQMCNQRRSSVGLTYDPVEWLYSESVVRRKLAAGLNREQVLADAHKAVEEKRKNWRSIQKRLASMTLSIQAPETDSPYQEN